MSLALEHAGTSSRLEDDEVAEILRQPKSPAFIQARDHLAYVHLVGCFPTHLRSLGNRIVARCTHVDRLRPGACGSVRVIAEYVTAFDLDNRPLVLAVRELQAQDFRIDLFGPRDFKGRRNYGRIWMFRRSDRAKYTVFDPVGALSDGWV